MEIQRFKKGYPLTLCGINQDKRDIPVIVNLTSIGKRLKTVPLCVRTLLSQSCRPDNVILWLSEYDVNGMKAISMNSLPRELLQLKKKGLEIRFCEDIGSHGKLIHALKEFPEAILVTADDDIVYPKDWLEKLYKSYLKEPDIIHCYRARLISFKENGDIDDYLHWPRDIDGMERDARITPIGVDGILYPPGSLDREVFNEAVFKEVCPKQDDVWFKAMTLLNDTYCKKVCSDHRSFPTIPGSQIVSLFEHNIDQNDIQIRETFDRYHLFEKLR